MAEGEGFEPTIPFSMPVFKTGALSRSATPPQRANIILSTMVLKGESIVGSNYFWATLNLLSLYQAYETFLRKLIRLKFNYYLLGHPDQALRQQ